MADVLDTRDETGADDEPLRSPHLARTVAIVVGIVLVLFIGLLATRKPADEATVNNALLNRAVPRVVGTTLDGRELDVDTLRGKWVVVNFFATWCTPCILEHPELDKFQKEHAAKGDAEVVSIVFNDQTNAVRSFFERNGGDWTVITSDDGRAAIDFGVTGIPESFVVAPNGLVVAHFEGVSAQALDDVLAQAPDAAVPGTTARATSGTAPR